MKAKSPLMASLQKAYRLALFSNQKNTPPVDELVEMSQEHSNSRRDFLTKSGIFMGAGLLTSACKMPDEESMNTVQKNARLSASTARVVIIGAGIAGLNAAYTLKKSGIKAKIYEASARVGGRMQTARNFFGQGITTEIGGEFIDSNHTEMLALAKEFNLELIDTELDTLKKQLFYIYNVSYSLEDVIKEFKKVAPKIAADQNKLDENVSNPASVKLDRTPLKQYLQSLKASAWFTELLDTAYVAEFGQATEEQSTLNFLTLISTDVTTGKFDVFGESDERYKIKGGNDLITKKLAQKVADQIELEEKLVAIVQTGKSYNLIMQSGKTVKADFVLLTLPLTTLRRVGLSIEGLTREKRACIQEYGYGDNSKLVLGFNQKIWRQAGYQGYMFNDKISDGWDSTQLQGSAGASYTVFTGGELGRQMAYNFYNKQVEIDKYLPIVERAFGNRKGQFNGKSLIAAWPTNQYALGSYGCFRPGQFTRFSSLVSEPIGNIYFAGEHCSEDAQGYMEGGAETGKSAAEVIIEKL